MRSSGKTSPAGRIGVHHPQSTGHNNANLPDAGIQENVPSHGISMSINLYDNDDPGNSNPHFQTDEWVRNPFFLLALTFSSFSSSKHTFLCSVPSSDLSSLPCPLPPQDVYQQAGLIGTNFNQSNYVFTSYRGIHDQMKADWGPLGLRELFTSQYILSPESVGDIDVVSLTLKGTSSHFKVYHMNTTYDVQEGESIFLGNLYDNGAVPSEETAGLTPKVDPLHFTIYEADSNGNVDFSVAHALWISWRSEWGEYEELTNGDTHCTSSIPRERTF